jgi:hypothetical protein
MEKSRFAGIKEVVPMTTLGLRSKKLPFVELPNSIRIFYLCHLYAFTNITLSRSILILFLFLFYKLFFWGGGLQKYFVIFKGGSI